MFESFTVPAHLLATFLSMLPSCAGDPDVLRCADGRLVANVWQDNNKCWRSQASLCVATQGSWVLHVDSGSSVGHRLKRACMSDRSVTARLRMDGEGRVVVDNHGVLGKLSDPVPTCVRVPACTDGWPSRTFDATSFDKLQALENALNRGNVLVSRSGKVTSNSLIPLLGMLQKGVTVGRLSPNDNMRDVKGAWDLRMQTPLDDWVRYADAARLHVFDCGDGLLLQVSATLAGGRLALVLQVASSGSSALGEYEGGSSSDSSCSSDSDNDSDSE